MLQIKKSIPSLVIIFVFFRPFFGVSVVVFSPEIYRYCVSKVSCSSSLHVSNNSC